MQTESIIGISAGVLTAASLVPQLVKIFMTKKTTGISVIMLLILMAGLGLWVVYGWLKNDWPVMITNSFSFLINICILLLRFRYKRK